jgi:U2-associated protein SR140
MDEKKLLGDDEVTDEFIRIVAVEVKSRGEEYEVALKEKEKGNSKYSFLADHKVRPTLSSKFKIYSADSRTN